MPFVGDWLFPDGTAAHCRSGLKVFVVAREVGAARAEAKKQLGIKARGRLPREHGETRMSDKATTWVLGRGPDRKLGEAIAELLECEAEAKKLEMRATLAKEAISLYCERRWCEETCSRDVATPIKLVNSKGQSVTYVIQDRTRSTRINASVYEELAGVIGKKAAANATTTKKVIYFADEVLDQVALDGRTVREATEEYVGLMAGDMVIQKVITQAQANALVEIIPLRTFIGGFLGRLPGLCDCDAEKFTAAIKAIGSAVTRYIKV